MRALIVSRAYTDPAARGKLKALATRGVTLAVAVPEHTTQGTPVTGGDDGGVWMVPIPVSDGPPAARRWSRRTLSRLVRELNPDLIQIEEEPRSPAAAAVRRVARRLHRPYVALVQESVPVRRGLVARVRRRRTLRDASALIATNSLALTLADDRPGERPHLIAPQLGLTLPATISRAGTGPLAIGFVGRLVPERGLDLLMRACVKIPGGWTLTVAGSGPAQEALERLAERLGIASRITWLGALPRAAVAELWPQLDCLAIPSRATATWVEPTGRTATEAMASGMPVVAARTGALPEVVGDGGIMVDDGDAAQLAEALERLCTDLDERHRLGVLARQRVIREYTDAAIADKTLRLWTAATA